jgi:hypothetical protein
MQASLSGGRDGLALLIAAPWAGEPELLLLPTLLPKPLASVGYLRVKFLGRLSSKLTFGSWLNITGLRFSLSVSLKAWRAVRKAGPTPAALRPKRRRHAPRRHWPSEARLRSQSDVEINARSRNNRRLIEQLAPLSN